MKEASAIILAGGKNTRIGRNKAFIQLSTGETILQNVINILQPIFPEIIIVTNQKDAYEKFNVPVVEDLIKESGSLGGIFTGLCYSTSTHNLVVACDMPFINSDLIIHLIQKSEKYDIVIPEVDGKAESLFARYSKRSLPVIFSHLEKGRLKIQDIFPKLKVLKISSQEIERFDPEHLSFFNVNTEKDLKKALEFTLRTR